MNIQGKDKVFLGHEKGTKVRIYIEKPKWNCGWYWGFGYLGNSNCHYHLNGFNNGRNINMHDALLKDYDLNPNIEKILWQFCEQAKTIYSLKEAASCFHLGGSHYTANNAAEQIKAFDPENGLNKVLLLELMQIFWNLIGGNDK